MRWRLWIGVGLVVGVTGCKGPTVNISTPEPIVVDINMRVDVFNKNPGGGAGDKAKAKPETEVAGADTRRKARLGDIQTFKNSRLVGENHVGMLVVRDQPAGTYGNYVAKTVNEENADRMLVMRQLASERNMALEDVQKQQGELWRNRAFSGEWIELPQDDGKTWKWGQKE